jgi:hypothetical protein
MAAQRQKVYTDRKQSGPDVPHELTPVCWCACVLDHFAAVGIQYAESAHFYAWDLCMRVHAHMFTVE